MKRFEVQVAFYVDAEDPEDAFQKVDADLMKVDLRTEINPDVHEMYVPGDNGEIQS